MLQFCNIIFWSRGGKLSSTKRFADKVLYVCTFFFIIYFFTNYTNYAVGREGQNCPKKKIQSQFWCETCKEIREFKDCDTADYIWDYEKYKAGSEEYADTKAHQDLPEAWGCQRIAYSCINKDCADYGKCIPHPGICETCMDDITSEKVWSKIDFKCTGCGKVHNDPGTGHKLNERIEYLPTLLGQEAGKCEECGKPLETVCRKSGTCPHIPSF
ncbi:MAG: hypothetical protein SCARUB_01027 [Candidatus Scalindua rubra]|uniref:Uncharacterized protein n=1 Tax=Candidatus Scalindua rubra TaxID=1872076 RepID=A0A1E3XE06_9BACT|nr:MAG: hypothetical protein SCARUB_01027 [Candidatus Scalindua rubra]